MGKICIVSGGMLPVPDVNGGAVEYLATELFRKLQSEQRHEVHVITIDAKNMEKDPCIHVVKTPAALGVLDRMVFFFGDRIKKDWRAMFYRRKYSTRYYRKQVAELYISCAQRPDRSEIHASLAQEMCGDCDCQ